jgi:serine/threonine protein kinase
MVTGRVPFEGETPLGIAMKHKSEEPKDPKELNTQLPEDLNLVILRCLEKDREKRYQSAGEVRAELTRIEKGIPTTEIEIPKRKPITSREITVTFGYNRNIWLEETLYSSFSIYCCYHHRNNYLAASSKKGNGSYTIRQTLSCHYVF